MLLVAHCMPQVSSYINAYPSFFCLLTVPQQQIFLYLLFSAFLTDKRLNIHLCSYLCLSSEPTLVLESLPGSTTHGKQTAPAESEKEGGRKREGEREREEVWWTDADADTSAGRSSSVQIRWWERRVEEKEGKGGGATLSCTGMKMTQGQYSQNHFSLAPSLRIRQWKGERGGTVSMATAEQRWVAVRKRAEAQWHVSLFFCLALRHLSSSVYWLHRHAAVSNVWEDQPDKKQWREGWCEQSVWITTGHDSRDAEVLLFAFK